MLCLSWHQDFDLEPEAVNRPKPPALMVSQGALFAGGNEDYFGLIGKNKPRPTSKPVSQEGGSDPTGIKVLLPGQLNPD